jgi:hypothetical protein
MRRQKGALTDAFMETLGNGHAVSFPLNGEPLAIVRNRKVAMAHRAAKSLNARVRTAISPDGQALCIWLEAKEA